MTAGWASAPAARASTGASSPAVARFEVTAQPERRVVFGTPSIVGARLVTEGGVRVPGQSVELLAKVRSSSTWRSITSEITDDEGRVTLRVALPASSALKLRHTGEVIVAPDAPVRSVVVATRVTVVPGRDRTRLGMPVVVSGRVAPARPAGSSVFLNRRAPGGWTRIASGRMVTNKRYVIPWEPRRPGSYSLRVVTPRDERHASGKSTTWRHRVAPERARDIARDILRNKNITLERIHASGGSYHGSAHQNINDVAHGRVPRHSCHGGAPCATSRIDLRVLQAVRDMGERGSLTVSELVGGAHSSGSAHYVGRGLDINWVNEEHVAPGSNYAMAVKRCRAHGATKIFSPANDPDGGHYNHIHCEWRPLRARRR